MKWIYLCFFGLAVVLAAGQDAPAQDAVDPDDYNDDDYDSYYDYDALKEEGDKLEAELDRLEAKNDKTVKEDIDKFVYDDSLPALDEENDDLEGLDEYQVEDNRDKPNADNKDAADKNSPIENEEAKRKADQDDYALLWGDDSVAPLPVPDVEPVVNDEQILEETRNILENDADDFESEIEKSLADPVLKPNDKIIEETLKILENTGDSFEEIDNKEENTDDTKEDESKNEAIKSLEVLAVKNKDDNQILEETKNILENLDDSFGENNDEAKLSNEKYVVDENIIQETKKILEETNDSFGDGVNETKIEGGVLKQDDFSEDDTVDKVKSDLNADLDELFDILDKLSVDNSVDDEKVEKIYNEIDEQLFKDRSEELVEDNNDYEEVDFDKILEDINNEAALNARNGDNSNAEMKNIVNDEINEPNPDDAFEKDVENMFEKSEDKPILFLDAIVDEPNKPESFEESDVNDNIDASIETNDDAEPKLDDKDSEKTKTIDISNLNSEELSHIVKQFAQAHSEVLNARDFDDNTAEHIKLSVNYPVEVTSPNYPNAYPTSDVKDWVFTGEGVGIELNITDFFVNGAMGHYLLLKPGGADDSDHQGLLFTYRLNSEKRFRFTDVDRLFVRFDATQGGWGMRGFQLSARMIAPIPAEPEPVPTPEPVLEPPHSVHTLHLAVAGPQFQQQREAFRILLADMAQQYIADNDIDPGLNTTSEVTQITSVSACPVAWPNSELCIAVTFGISLNYEEGDPMLDNQSLREMWETYSTRDPFALRLRQMGFAEFQPPSRTVLIPWLAVSSAVVLAAVLVVILLYRYNCFEDYTRMKDLYDTDSIANEKRGLDLYPTPHQTLPPLYAEQEYKWADNEDTTRVDMGGLANRSYARDMYDFESDDEVPQRTGAVTARDSYVHNSNA